MVERTRVIGSRLFVSALLAGTLTIAGPGLESAAATEHAPAPGEVVASFITQGCETWEVPEGVTAVAAEVVGSAGESFLEEGGRADRMEALVSAIPGENLRICVGVNGGSPRGGGASGLALGSDFSNPLVIAGGGGGGGVLSGVGGDAGMPRAQDGGGSENASGGGGGDNDSGPGGGGGTDAPCAAGTIGGVGGSTTSAGPGAGGSGAHTAACYGPSTGSGGGGAGFYGGGGGPASPWATGGGGGTSYCALTCLRIGGQTGVGAGETAARVVLRVPEAPDLPAPSTATFREGRADDSATVTATGYPTPSLTRAGTLPAGVSFTDNGDGTATFSGTPSLATKGSYQVTVTASNGVPPNATLEVTLVVEGPPGAPQEVSGVAGNRSVALTWSAPDDHGETPITGYTVTSSPGARTCSTGGDLTCSVTGLRDGTAYTFTVTATNAVGVGSASTPSPPVTPAHGFVDVPLDDYYSEAVGWLKATEITTGYGNPTVFAPNEVVTRAQMAAFLHRLMDVPEVGIDHGFDDIPVDVYYEEAVTWLKQTGVTTGYGSLSIYAPNVEVTRAQMAAFLWRVAGSPVVDEPHEFTDVPSDTFYEMALSWLKEHEIITGYGSPTMFAPDVLVTRGQMAASLYRLAKTPVAWHPDVTLPNTADM